LEVEQAGGEFGVELAGLDCHVDAGVDEVFPFDDPVVGQGVEVAQLAAEGGEGEQESQVGGDGAGVAAAVEVEVEVVVVADHGVAEPIGGHGELQG
jgi:hypothetical protein